ncbi:MAG: NAD(P)-dependent oxidoreductase [Chitinispirillaceae bacterium]|nr:NAD(P)-dependent oxidoreductase [Chitinispirillaceae bacterium]
MSPAAHQTSGTLEASPASLAGKVLFITGASRGIGEAIALRAARDGGRIAVIGKTDQPHPKLKGTVHTACRAIEEAGGEALACIADIRDEEAVERSVKAAVERFGGIDILVNNAAAISLTTTADTPMKRFDLMHALNVRGPFLCSRKCLPFLVKSANPHILNLSPPPRLKPEWFSGHLAYTMSKYGLSLFTLGLAHELAPCGIAVNSLWPRTIIATAAVENHFGPEMLKRCRYPAIVADAAHTILTRLSREFTGRFCIDEELLRETGIRDFSGYAVEAGKKPMLDLYIDPETV